MRKRGVRKEKTIGIRIEPEKWEQFCFACAKYGKAPGDVLRELIEHVDAAVTAIQTRQIVMLNGDLVGFIRRRFPQMQPWQWQLFADTFNEIAEMVSGGKSETKLEATQAELKGIAEAFKAEG